MEDFETVIVWHDAKEQKPHAHERVLCRTALNPVNAYSLKFGAWHGENVGWVDDNLISMRVIQWAEMPQVSKIANKDKNEN